MTSLDQYARDVAMQARSASRDLACVAGQAKIAWLNDAAQRIRDRADDIIDANKQDIAKAPDYGLNASAIDRLTLDPSRLNSIATAVEQIALLPDPIGEIIDSNPRPNGLLVTRVRVPLGVVFFIYESRPNVTVDAAALCVKSGNSVILRGGKEAFHSNQAFYRVLSSALSNTGLPEGAVQLVETTDREAVGHFLRLGELIDVTVPRGGKSLIERVASEATMPVIKHYDGICHVYVDANVDHNMAESIVINSKCQRPGVCNAAETLLVHAAVAGEFVPRVASSLREHGVEIRGCPRSRELVEDVVPATDDDYRTEYLDLVVSLRVVDNLAAAVDHIATFGSSHTDAIVTSDIHAARAFSQQVDSAAVMVNASTRFNDGGEFGLGAEIGISTDRFHARGPCGLREMTSYKYIVHGDGQVK